MLNVIYVRITFLFSVAFLLIACDSGGGTNKITTAAPKFTLQCDLNAVYTPESLPEVTTATGSTTTVIALHGKNGSPIVSLQALPPALNVLGYDVVMPYMPWRGVDWDGTLCDGLSYINSLIVAERNAGKSVILLGHSLAGPIVLSYMALSDTTKPNAVTVLAPGHFINLSSVLAAAHETSIQLAKTMVAVGNGNMLATFETLNGGSIRDLNTTANIYLSYHDTEQFPNIETSVPLVSKPMLWLAGEDDRLTSIADDTFGLITLIPDTPDNVYKVIAGNHFTMVNNVPAELDPWYASLN